MFLAPPYIQFVPVNDPNEDRARNIVAMEGHLRRLKALAAAGQEFLIAVFGRTVAADPARVLATAWYDYEATEISERIELLKAAPPIETNPYPATPEMMVDLQAQLARVDSQIENFHTALEKISDTVPGMAEIFKATALPMLESQRDHLNVQIEHIQAKLDEQNQKQMEAPKNESNMDQAG